MRRNQKLTKVIAGRIIKAVTTEPGSVLVQSDAGRVFKCSASPQSAGMAADPVVCQDFYGVLHPQDLGGEDPKIQSGPAARITIRLPFRLIPIFSVS